MPAPWDKAITQSVLDSQQSKQRALVSSNSSVLRILEVKTDFLGEESTVPYNKTFVIWGIVTK